MLKKLLKYDLRANMKIFLFVWPAILLFSLLERLIIQARSATTSSKILVGATVTIYILGVIAACVFALVISVVRFYSGLLRNEGYLMFTLPVKPWQLIVSKFLTALLTITVTTVLSVVCSIILFTGAKEFFQGLFYLFHNLRNEMSPFSYFLCVLLFFAAISAGILQIYAACSIGHLANRHRILLSVLSFYAIQAVLQIVAAVVFVVLTTVRIDFIVTLVYNWSSQAVLTLILSVFTCYYALLGVVFYFITHTILCKHLNLE